VDEADRRTEARPVRSIVEPARHAGRMWERDYRRAVELEPHADRVREPLDAEQAPQRKPADGDDQLWAKEPQLVLAPRRAERLLGCGRGAIASARGRAAG
jgi:hypothetical protein